VAFGVHTVLESLIAGKRAMEDLEQLASPLFCKSHLACSNGIQGATFFWAPLRKRHIKGMKLEMYDL
jgi:hypothetical protein